MSNTFTWIQNVTAPSTQNVLRLDNIPQTYDDLVIKIFARAVGTAAQGMYLLPNGGSSDTFSQYVIASPSGTGAGTIPNNGIYVGSANGTNATANTFAQAEVWCMNYRATDRHKLFYAISGTPSDSQSQQYANLIGSTWKVNGTAITYLDFTIAGGNNIHVNSTLSLYGIKRT